MAYVRATPTVLSVATLACALLAACSGSAIDRADRDRALADNPVRADLEAEPLRGDLLAGVKAYNDGELDAAEAALLQHLVATPRSAAAYYQLGLVETERQHPDKARPLFEKALELNPQMHGAASNLGVLYLQADEDVAALRMLEKAYDLAPDDARVLANLGAARLRRGLWSEAVDAYRMAVKLAPGHGTLLLDLALAFLERHEYAEALKVLDEALGVRPRFASAQAARVVCLQGLGDLAAAEAYARQSLDEVAEPVVDNYVVLARVLVARRQVPEALKQLHKALDLDAADPTAQLALAELLDATGQKVEALAWYEKFMKNAKHNPDTVRRARDRVKRLQAPPAS